MKASDCDETSSMTLCLDMCSKWLPACNLKQPRVDCRGIVKIKTRASIEVEVEARIAEHIEPLIWQEERKVDWLFPEARTVHVV